MDEFNGYLDCLVMSEFNRTKCAETQKVLNVCMKSEVLSVFTMLCEVSC